jgi:hypothetical protein
MRFSCRTGPDARVRVGLPILCLGLLLALGVAGCAHDLRPLSSTALSREYSHRIWRMPDGLPQNRIQAFSQTPDGYLWIGTEGGRLLRYRNGNFTTRWSVWVWRRSPAPSPA